MNTTGKIFLSVISASFILATAVCAFAADPTNYGNRTVRITSKCPSSPDVPPPSAQDVNCPTVPTIAQSPSGRWSVDISWFDPATRKYYLADRNAFGIDIIDVTTDKVVGFAGGFVGTNCPLNGSTPDCTLGSAPANSAGPNGVLTTPGQLWAGDGNGTVKVFSLDTAGLPTALIKSVNAGGVKRADEMAFDPDDGLVLVAWDDDADLFVAFISANGNPTVMGTIKIPEAAGCGIEQPAYSRHLKKFFLAVPCTSAVNAANKNTAIHDNGEIAVIDPLTKSIINVYGLDGTLCFPHGLAVGPRDQLLLGCSGDAPAGSQLKSIIMDATSGSILQTFTQLGGSDEVWYSPADNHYYLAMSSWTSTGLIGGTSAPSLGIINAGDFVGGASFVQNIPTSRTSHSVAAVAFGMCKTAAGNFGPGSKIYVNDGTGDKECHSKVYTPLTPAGSDKGGIGIYGQIR